LPGLAQRPEDLEPNIDHLLLRAVAETGSSVRFNAEARALYLQFAKSAQAPWSGNFRDLAASITRLATLADSGRITTRQVEAEIKRLDWLWQHSQSHVLPKAEVDLGDYLSEDAIAQIDLFDRLQLQSVIAVCRASTTLSDAGRKLFDQSRQQKAVVNDADRLRKFLHKFGLNWEQLKQSY
jgi:transcriptional regulatory protein RtcR